MNLPAYSVILPVYNGANTLAATLQSVAAQTHLPEKVYLINDASTDDTREVAEDLAHGYPFVELSSNRENLGVAATRNLGFQMVTSPYVALLDADDGWLPEKMELQLTQMLETDCDFSYTGYVLLFPDGSQREYHVPPEISFQSMLVENVIGCSTAVLKTTVAQEFPMSNAFFHEDYFYWMTLLQQGKKACGLPLPLMEYHLSPDSRSGNKKEAAKNRWNIYRKGLGLSLPTSVLSFVRYAWRGFRKHR